MSYDTAAIKAGLKHLLTADSVMRRLIGAVGPFQIRLDRDRFRSLVRSIISQQISGSAARAIHERLRLLVQPEKISAESLIRLSPAQFRSAGISPQKTGYLLDLANKVLGGRVKLKKLARVPDDEIIRELVQVKGIGVWTAQMFLIFSVGRMDVFPHDDLGIRVALRHLYRLRDMPDKAVSHRIAEPWRPFATMASWYCWRSLELVKGSRNAAPLLGE